MLHTHEATGSSPVVSTKTLENALFSRVFSIVCHKTCHKFREFFWRHTVLLISGGKSQQEKRPPKDGKPLGVIWNKCRYVVLTGLQWRNLHSHRSFHEDLSLPLSRTERTSGASEVEILTGTLKLITLSVKVARGKTSAFPKKNSV